jgi:hypothetical protein
MYSMDTSLQLTGAMGPLESHGTPCSTLGPWASPYTQVLGHMGIHAHKLKYFGYMWMRPHTFKYVGMHPHTSNSHESLHPQCTPPLGESSLRSVHSPLESPHWVSSPIPNGESPLRAHTPQWGVPTGSAPHSPSGEFPLGIVHSQLGV